MERSFIDQITVRLRDHHDRDPWYGKSAHAIFQSVEPEAPFWQPAGGHSILELLWHMITWREFVLSRLVPQPGLDLAYFESHDWRPLDHSDRSLWPKGLARYDEVHPLMMEAIDRQDDAVLAQIVPGRQYDFRYLLEGIVEHDVYHLGQVALVNKLFAAQRKQAKPVK